MKNKFVLTVILFANILALPNCSANQQGSLKNVQFQKFRLNTAAGPCQEGVDCSGSIEIASNGTLTYDKFGELPQGSIHVTTITQSELETITPALTESALISLLDLPGQICQPATDTYENMALWTMDGAYHSHETTSCDSQPIKDARQALTNLVNNYF